MKFSIPKPRVSKPVNRTPGIGMRGPGTRAVDHAVADDAIPPSMREKAEPISTRPVRRSFGKVVS